VNNIFITATGRDKGKTALTIGLLKILKDELGEIGFMKPAGQRYVEKDGVKVGEDVALINSIYNFKSEFSDMSPIIIDKGFTEKHIPVNKNKQKRLADHVFDAYSRIRKDKKMVVMEGSGRCSVGDCFGLSNIKIAEMTDAGVILIAEGGIGNTIDNCMLNKAYLEKYNVEILGVIINKVYKEKYDKIASVTSRGLKKGGLKVLGVIPYEPFLSQPTLKVILEEFSDLELLTKGVSDKYLLRNIPKIIVGAMTPHQALKYLSGGELLITGGDREDILIATLCRAAISAVSRENESSVSAIIATGGLKPHSAIIEVAEKLEVPVFLAGEDTYTVASKIKELTIKIKPGDEKKIDSLTHLVRENIDLETIISFIQENKNNKA